MPVYEFRCLECRKPFRLTLSIAERAGSKVECPKCRGRKIEAQYTAIRASSSRKG